LVEPIGRVRYLSGLHRSRSSPLRQLQPTAASILPRRRPAVKRPTRV
jgi:hypothetical protein